MRSQVPPCWTTFVPKLVWVFGEVGALDVSSVSDAAVLINAVLSRLYGLAQPVSIQM